MNKTMSDDEMLWFPLGFVFYHIMLFLFMALPVNLFTFISSQEPWGHLINSGRCQGRLGCDRATTTALENGQYDNYEVGISGTSCMFKGISV